MSDPAKDSKVAESLQETAQSFQGLFQSFTDFSWSMSVFGVSQSAKVIRHLATSDPGGAAQKSFQEVSATVREQFDGADNTIYNAGHTVGNALLSVTFNFFQPNTFNPSTILETGQNLTRWAAGLTAQFVPGGIVGTGGPPVGWGPVNAEDAEL